MSHYFAFEWPAGIPLPTFWAGITLFLGALAAFLVVRKFGPLQSEALNQLAGAYKQQIVATQETLAMQKEHYEMEITDCQSEREKMRIERDDYRTKLHTEKEQHQATILQVTELHQRPNVDKVYESLERNFDQQTQTLRQIQQSLEKHDASIQERMDHFSQPIVQACAEMVSELKKRPV